MDEKIKASWEKVLHPDTLRTNIITASMFIAAFEMLKNSIVEKIEGFYINGFDEYGPTVGPEYKEKVLSLNRSKLYASLQWLQDNGVIDKDDVSAFEHVKRCRNTLTHEMLKFASEGVDFDIDTGFQQIVALVRKIEMWWFVNLEMAIDPDAYPEDLDLNEVTPGPVWSLQMLLDIALGPKAEAIKYYEHFVKTSGRT